MFIDNLTMLSETLGIFKNGSYVKNGASVKLKLSEKQQTTVQVFLPGEIEKFSEYPFSGKTDINNSCVLSCENMDSFTMARKIADMIAVSDNPEDRVLVLNLANPVHPGGGVRHGARAQEEDLCRKSSLLLSLESREADRYYSFNRSLKTFMGSDAVIVTPDVEIIRDENGNLLDETVVVSVITCAAPMLKFGKEGMTEEAYQQMLYHRIVGLLKCAAFLGYRYLVLGAWGCGAFGNDARVVSDLFAKAIRELKLNGRGTDVLFRRIDFAVLSRSRTQYNFTEFSSHFNVPDFYGDKVTNDEAQYRDRFRGCLAGGAAGDALGYEVEFDREEQIFTRFGKKGITEYVSDRKTGKANISDDTQMTLFTASGILAYEAEKRKGNTAASMRAEIEKSYFDWYITQCCSFQESRQYQKHNSFLYDVPELFSRRAPGNTCLSALRERISSEDTPESYIQHKLNRSKGCGGVMRAAPVGLCTGKWDIETIDREAAEAAAITHSHSLGYLPAAALAHIVNRIVFSDRTMTLKEIVLEAKSTVEKIFCEDPHIGEFSGIMTLAVELSENSDSDLDNIHRIGEGWVGEEALAIAVYCALRYQNDFSAGIIAAVNHKGDSDSTGAVAGNILGALVGFDAIDKKWKTDLELLDVTLQVADELFEGGLEKSVWEC